MYINFTINGQTLEREDENSIIEDSVRYLKAKFAFSEDWADYTKTAFFDGDYGEILDENGECIVPWEVLTEAEKIRVTVIGHHGASVITTNGVNVKIKSAGLEGGSVKGPTPGIYAQILARMEDCAEASADAAKSAAKARASANSMLETSAKISQYYEQTGERVNELNEKLGEKNHDGAIHAIGEEELQKVLDSVDEKFERLTQTDPTGIPLLFLYGTAPTTKDAVKMRYEFVDGGKVTKGWCSIKCQGTSSMYYPKKNFTIKTYADLALSEKTKFSFLNWGAQNKFCLKANWIDITHARNVVTARLWGDVVKSRAHYEDSPDKFKEAPNVGAVDGFFIKVYINGDYQGRYTMNIPKGDWMANMDKKSNDECILCGEDFVSGCFRAEAKIDESDWSDELHDKCPDNIKLRWNECIRFVMQSSDEEFYASIGDYFDVESLIDYYVFAMLTCGLDSMGKNQLYLTYDGVKWFASMYDLDSTWGLIWTGEYLVRESYPRNNFEDSVGDRSGNLLYQRVEKLFADEIKARYTELIENALSTGNIIRRFEEFMNICSAELVAEDYAATTAHGRFTGIPSKSITNIQQIRQYAADRQTYCTTRIVPESLFDADGTDALGHYVLRFANPLRLKGTILNSGYKPYDVQKNWTIAVKFSADFKPEGDYTTATVFCAREWFAADNTGTCVALRVVKGTSGNDYNFNGGFGGFNFPFDNAPGYEPSTDGYHYAVISNNAGQYSIYLDGGLAYNCPLGYAVTDDHLTQEPLYLFGAVSETGYEYDFGEGEIADFRIYDRAFNSDDVLKLFNDLKQ